METDATDDALGTIRSRSNNTTTGRESAAQGEELEYFAPYRCPATYSTGNKPFTPRHGNANSRPESLRVSHHAGKLLLRFFIFSLSYKTARDCQPSRDCNTWQQRRRRRNASSAPGGRPCAAAPTPGNASRDRAARRGAGPARRLRRPCHSPRG